MEVEALGLGNRFFKRSDAYILEAKEANKDPSFVKVMINHNGGSLRLAKTILDASRSSNVRDLGSVDESAAAFEKRSKRLNLETDS
ncbi:unnamed protein product [Brassica rapa]|uniref:DUF1771 domain-containing protein n=2 Tax=Brassica TaxID=3705 RepID=A0A3P6ACV9_BRACM|nr:unnamed protein product [Brassica napus]CAG7891631.1 unnamed protein product [Brassica rapa]VDC85294.1 unnamed protein product [Brassica rapa]